jgi:acyl-CoA thioester hydrolase
MSAAPSSGAFEGLEHVLPVRVYYEDTDFTGIVYHANYLRFFERGRTEFLRAIGVEHAALLALPEPCAFAVTKLSIAYRRPARVDDALEVRTLNYRISSARTGVRQRVLRSGELLTEAEVEIVCIGLDGRPCRPPPELTTRLAPYLSQAAP